MSSTYKIISLLLFVAIFSCKKEQPKTNNIFKYKEYIGYTTSGRVSVADKIIISLNKDVENWTEGQELPNEILTIKPYIEGTLFAENNHRISFVPTERLQPNTEYTVTVKLDKIFKNVSKEYKHFNFSFKTITPNFTLTTNELQSYNKKWQYIEGLIKSADIISLTDAKKIIKASQKGKSKSIVWNESFEKSKIFEFRIDSIQRLEEDTNILVKWNGKSIKADNSGENTIVIPGVNNFKITNLEVQKNNEQYISINFSDPLKKQQNFDGLISVQNVKKPKFIVDGNVLKVYIDSKLLGNIKVDVFQGIQNTDGYKLKKPFSETLSFQQQNPQVRLLGNGTLLPNSKELKFNFEAVNLKAVDLKIIKIFEDNVLQFLQDNNLKSNNDRAIRQVGRRVADKTIQLVEKGQENTHKWKAYSFDLSDYFNADIGAIYRVELSFKKEYSLYKCDDTTEDKSTIESDFYENELEKSIDNEDEKEEQYWDNVTYRYRNHNYNWQERNNPCHDAYYNYERIVSKNLISSNLGVIVKKGTNNSYLFAVTNIINTQPESAAKITLYNYQQQELLSTKTDTDGFAKINVDKNAFFAIVSKGKNRSYLKLLEGNTLSLSKFDVSGGRLQKGLKGYIYGERGVWRPGDSLHLTFMLNDAANELPKNHPVKLEVTDSRGKLIFKEITTKNTNRFYKFTVATTPESSTGNYNAKISVGGAKFHKSLKVETVKPNRLKIKIDFDTKVLSSKEPIKGNLQINWLHGAPAKNIKVEVKAKISNAHTSFTSFKDYVFSDPTRKFSTEEINIFEGKVTKKGFANFTNKLSVGKNAPGMLNIQFLVRAFENGGDFSIDAFTKTYAPFVSFVGLKSPKGNSYGSFFTDENQTFSIASVDDTGKPIRRKNIEVKIYQIKWRWWWNSSSDNLSKYTTSSYHKPYKTFKVNTNSNGKATIKINIPEKDRGRFLIRIIDPISGHATGRVAYFYKNWWKNSPSNDKEAAKMLVFSSDKKTYKVGETAKITFPSGTEGRALISIENGTEVIDYKWVKTIKGETVVDIPVTDKMAPNVYVNISLLQPHQVSENDLPIRLYGIIPLLVENPSTKLNPQILMPEVLRPEEEFTVVVSEKENKEMTYTLAIVEEGLLDLTRFKTPNAFNQFYAREALGVKTWDIFDDVIGAYSGSIDQVFAIGGDGANTKGKNRKANRFKPVVKYLGPFLLEKGAKKSHKIKLPNYIGSVRAMVVAGNVNKEAYGSEEKTVPVKKPLMVLATLPRKLSPGEKVMLPVTVFAMEKNVKNVSIRLQLSDGISVIGNKTKTLHFDKSDEKMVYFELDVSKAKGINSVEVLANGNGEKAKYSVEIDVINPNPITSKVLDKTMQANQTIDLNFSTFGVYGSNTAKIEFSTIPPINFEERLEYLIRYPHGCLEQTTSSVFPQLFLSDIFDITFNKKKEIQGNIENGIKRLSNFQQANGGMSYWMGENYSNDWATSYAGHFMLEAEKKGYVLPLTFKSNWIKYQKSVARNWRANYRNNNSALAQAYRLYTLALAKSADLSAMNRLREYVDISNEAKWRLAAAYALVGQKEASEQIMSKATINFKNDKNSYYTYGSIDRNRAMALETMLLTKNPNSGDLAKLIAKDLSSNKWMSTQTTAFCLLSIGKMIELNGGKEVELTYVSGGKTKKITSEKTFIQRNLSIKNGLNTVQIKNHENNVLYVRIINSGKLPLGKEISVERGFNVSVAYKDLKGNVIDISKLQQGQDFVANISVNTKNNQTVKDIALTQIFPSGWEIVNTRFTDFGTTTKSKARYTDIRDDRVNFYFDLNRRSSKAETKIFSVLLNASYLGTYYLPGTQVEAMYDDDYLVRTKGRWIKVVK